MENVQAGQKFKQIDTDNTAVRVWTRQLHTPEDDVATAVAADAAGNVYVTGYTLGRLDGNGTAGYCDIFLTKYDVDGAKQWTKTVGLSGNDAGNAVAVDRLGYVYVTGYIEGSLDFNTPAENRNIVVLKYDRDGNLIWMDEEKTTQDDEARAIAVDESGNVYVAGFTQGIMEVGKNVGGKDAFLIKYNNVGRKEWLRQFGTSENDAVCGIAVDGSGIYLTGYTQGEINGGRRGDGYDDILLTKFSRSGQKLWERQIGSPKNDAGYGIAAAAGNVYITGHTEGAIGGNRNSGGKDIILAAFDGSNGKQLWMRQFGTAEAEEGKGLAVDDQGNSYITGYTDGGLDGTIKAGSFDIFFIKVDAKGQVCWMKQMGTIKKDEGRAICRASGGAIYIAGYTNGSLEGNSNINKSDIFVMKWKDSNRAPYLNWTNEAHFGAGGEFTPKGEASIFRVMYKDPDNDEPLQGYPKVHIKRNGKEIEGSPFAMYELDESGVNYTEGKIFTFSKTLNGGGRYSYYFEAYDGYKAKAGGKPTEER